MKNNILNIFEKDVFTEKKMKKSLPYKTYKKYRELIENRKPLTLDVAN